MTGGRKNEQFDIVTQAQKIIDEYEKKYFECLNSSMLHHNTKKKVTRVLLVFFFAVSALFAVAMKILL